MNTPANTLQLQTPAKPSVTPVRSGILQRACACGKHTSGGGGECEECKKKRTGSVQRAAISASPIGEVPGIVHQVLNSPGQALDGSTRALMEPRFEHDFSHTPLGSAPSQAASAGLSIGAEDDGLERQARAVGENFEHKSLPASAPRLDFSQVRIHTGPQAAASARAVNALAYTVGQNVVFDQGQYAPHSRTGQKLLAHELTHVLQQSVPLRPGRIQRDAKGDKLLADANTALITDIKATAAYKALAPADVTLTTEIITEIQKRSLVDQNGLLTKLKALFNAKVKPPATISAETKASTVTATAQEAVRVAKPAEAKNTNIEETASADKARKWVGFKGKFGGGTYYVDNSSATNIVVRAKVNLTPAGTGTADDVKNIKKMEDGIEKAASTKGYLVDITFVDVADADTFKIHVDPSKWEDATNWSGGDPSGFAHELHHCFAFELDRYNYIDLHAGNASMKIDQRLIWFRKELSKPANFNDPTSIMGLAMPHPNDVDVCTVAGMDMKTCLEARQKAAKKP